MSSRRFVAAAWIAWRVAAPEAFGAGVFDAWARPRNLVGAAIVVRARESRVHGEGPQGIDVRLPNNRRLPGEVLVLLVTSYSDERRTDG